MKNFIKKLIILSLFTATPLVLAVFNKPTLAMESIDSNESLETKTKIITTENQKYDDKIKILINNFTNINDSKYKDLIEAYNKKDTQIDDKIKSLIDNFTNTNDSKCKEDLIETYNEKYTQIEKRIKNLCDIFNKENNLSKHKCALYTTIKNSISADIKRSRESAGNLLCKTTHTSDMILFGHIADKFFKLYNQLNKLQSEINKFCKHG